MKGLHNLITGHPDYPGIPFFTMDRWKEHNIQGNLPRGRIEKTWNDENGIPYAIWTSGDERFTYIIYVYEHDGALTNVHEGASWGVWDSHTLTDEGTPDHRVIRDRPDE